MRPFCFPSLAANPENRICLSINAIMRNGEYRDLLDHIVHCPVDIMAWFWGNVSNRFVRQHE